MKTALLSLVGASLSTDGWEDGVLAEALSQGLADLNAWMPPIESSFTVVTPGAEQDLRQPGAAADPGRGYTVGG